jgi:5-methyltetrahydrofolate--homocysteine methyltransferase
MSDRFQKLLNSRPFLMADGATGTNLFAAGLMTGDAPEMWNFEHPERIEALHQSFVDAGADLFLTNSFGGTRYRLKLHNAQDKVREINREAARIARRVADKAGREVIVAGSIGPTGELYDPLGPLMTVRTRLPSRPRRWPKAGSICCGSRPCRRRKR